MASRSSIKMYLTIFIATTCMYMVLYQYHISRQPMPQPDIRHKDKSIDLESTNGNGGSYITSSTSLSSNKISSSTSASTTSSSSASSSSASSTNATNLNAVKLLASNKLTKSTTKSSSALTNSFKLLSLPSGTSKLFKSMNIFLWSPMSLLSSSSSSSAKSKRVISKKSTSSKPSSSSLVLQQEQQHSGKSSLSSSTSSSSKSSLSSSSVMALNNTLLLTTSTSSSSTTSTVASTTTRLTTSTTTKKSNTKPTLSQTTIVNNNHNKNKNNNNDKLSAQQHQQQLIKANLVTPPLYIITPTYRRPEQLAELTRLGYTLKHVMNLLWLVIEDANKTSELVLQTLNRIGVPYEYFLAPMPEEYKKTKKAKPRGVSNRNRGLKWLRENATEGVFYFADDDNTYDISLFEQMRYTKKVSMFPVGLVTKYGVSTPIINKSGKIIGFYDGWIGGRKYPVDMAGFAVSVKFLHDRPEAKMPFKPGYEEDGFLKSLAPLNLDEIELLANNCTEILCWHTQTKKNNPADILNMTKYGDTNLVLLDSTLVRH